MNAKLTVLGVNVTLVSLLLGIYGVYVDDRGLLGVAVSAGIVGGVLIVYSLEPVVPTRGALSYTSILVNAVTAVLEDLDLLNGNLCAVNDGENLLIVYSKSSCVSGFNPGIGVTMGSPYLSIPVPESAFSDVIEMGDLEVSALESSLSSVLVEGLGLFKGVKVERRGDTISVELVGLAKSLSEYARYPVNPAVLLTLAVIGKLWGRGRAILVDRKEDMESVHLIIKVERVD